MNGDALRDALHDAVDAPRVSRQQVGHLEERVHLAGGDLHGDVDAGGGEPVGVLAALVVERIVLGEVDEGRWQTGQVGVAQRRGIGMLPGLRVRCVVAPEPLHRRPREEELVLRVVVEGRSRSQSVTG